MKKIIIITLFIMSLAQLSAQNLPTEKIDLTVDRSLHGAGDMIGISMDAAYTKYFTKRFSAFASLGATIHDKQVDFYYDGTNNEFRNFPFINSGLQFAIGAGYSLIRTRKNELAIQAGSLLRWQTSSLPSAYSIYFDKKVSGIPEVMISYNKKLKTFAIGYLTDISYNYTFKNNILVGANIKLQNDTEGDIITGYGLKIGKRL